MVMEVLSAALPFSLNIRCRPNLKRTQTWALTQPTYCRSAAKSEKMLWGKVGKIQEKVATPRGLRHGLKNSSSYCRVTAAPPIHVKSFPFTHIFLFFTAKNLQEDEKECGNGNFHETFTENLKHQDCCRVQICNELKYILNINYRLYIEINICLQKT